MKKLFLHIGSYKTGTTSIQNTLAKNRNGLAKQGFVYPGRDVNHHKFIFSCNPTGDEIPRQFRGINKIKLNQIISPFFLEIEKDFSRRCDSYIISSEYLFIYNEKLVAQTVKYLKRFFSEIQLIVFIRDPVKYYASLQQQSIKARSFIDSPSDFKYEFKKVIETWQSQIPMQILKYGSGVDSLEVFCRTLGMSTIIFKNQSTRINTSLSVEQMLLLEKIQCRLYKSYEDRFKNHLGVIHQIKHSGLFKPELKDEVKKMIYKNHFEDLLWLKENYQIDFLNEEYEVDSTDQLSIYDRDKVSVRDVFKVPNEQTIEKYEAHVIDLLLKKLVQRVS